MQNEDFYQIIEMDAWAKEEFWPAAADRYSEKLIYATHPLCTFGTALGLKNECSECWRYCFENWNFNKIFWFFDKWSQGQTHCFQNITGASNLKLYRLVLLSFRN